MTQIEHEEESPRAVIERLRQIADKAWPEHRDLYSTLHQAAYLIGQLDVSLHHHKLDLAKAVEALKGLIDAVNFHQLESAREAYQSLTRDRE